MTDTSDLHADEFKKLFAPTSKDVRDLYLEKKHDKFRNYKKQLDAAKASIKDVIKKEKDFENFSHIDVVSLENPVEQLDIDACMKEYLDSEYTDNGLYWIGAFDEDYIKVKGTEAQDIIKRRARGAKVATTEEEMNDDEDDLEFLNPKQLTKQEALEVFTGRKHIGKKFQFVTQAMDKLLNDVKQRTIVGGELATKKLNVSVDRALVKKAVEQLIIFENKTLKDQETDVMIGGRKNKTNRATTELQTKFLISPSFFVNVVTVVGKPSTTGTKPYIIPLKKSLYNADETTMCLFVRDDKKAEFKELLSEQPFFDNLKIMKLSKLLKVKSYQEKHLLVSQYDFFFAENEIITSMVPFLGKAFYSKNKGPRPVTLENAVEWMNKELAGTKVFLRPGQETLDVKIARLSWTVSEIVDNILDYVNNKLVQVVPFGAENIVLKLYLRTIHSPALPLYVDISSQENLYAKTRAFKAEKDFQKNAPKRSREDSASEEEEAVVVQEPATKKKKVNPKKK